MAEHGEMSGASVRVAATRADAELAGKLLDDFLAEFDTPSPGAAKVGERLATAIAADDGLIYYQDWATDTMFDTLPASLQELVGGRTTPEDFVSTVQDDWATFQSNR